MQGIDETAIHNHTEEGYDTLTPSQHCSGTPRRAASDRAMWQNAMSPEDVKEDTGSGAGEGIPYSSRWDVEAVDWEGGPGFPRVPR